MDQPTKRLWRVVSVLGLVSLVLLAAWAWFAYTEHRFEEFSEVADARILGSDLGCISAQGSRSPGGPGSIRYEIEFPYAGGLHTTSVRRPCDVIPPDFGRGRGYILVEYDRDHPDRVRVVLDDTVTEWARLCRNAFVTVLVAAGVLLCWRWQQGARLRRMREPNGTQ